MVKVSKPGIRRSYAIVSPDNQNENILDIDFSDLRDWFTNYGALLFRGFPMDLATFSRITGLFCTHAVTNDSPSRDIVDKAHAIQTVDLGEDAFPLHPELAREPWKPDVCFFACIEAPRYGGETNICDGVKVVQKLSRKTRRMLEQRRIRYSRRATSAELKFWLGSTNVRDKVLQNPPDDCPFEFQRVRGQIIRSFTRPALHRTMFSDELCFGNFLLFARYLHQVRHFPVFDDGTEIPDEIAEEIKKVGDKLTQAISWQNNDLLILDNSRFMHGRNAIESTEERKIVTYFGFLNFAIPSSEEGIAPRWRKSEDWRRMR